MNQRKRDELLVAAVLAACVGGTAFGQCELNKKTPTDAEFGDLFGRSVAIDGDLAVVGVTQDKRFGLMTGSVAVFSRDSGGTDNWAQILKLEASDGAHLDQFGYSVDIDGATIVVGAPTDDDNGSSSGSVYVFEENDSGDWVQVKKLTASDGAQFDYFGVNVDLSGDTLIVGAYLDDDNGSASGSAYVFERNQGGDDQWGEVAKLTANDGAAYDNFGMSVAIDGDFALVGSQRDDDAGSSSGAAYVFYRDAGGENAWGQARKLTASDAAANDQFGISVSIHGNVALIGAYLTGSTGAAYVFGCAPEGPDLWGEVAKLTATDGEQGDGFGYAVSLFGSFAVVGAVGDDDGGMSSGSAYLFGRDQGGTDNWGQISKLVAADGAMFDLFGLAVAVQGDVVLVGAVYDDDAGPNSGSAYVFTQDTGGTDAWGEFKKLTATDGAGDLFGHSVAIDGDIALAGSPLDDPVGEDSGSVYIFGRDTDGLDAWGRIRMLLPTLSTIGEQFGVSVGVSDDWAVVGAPGNQASGPFTGAAYFFERNAGGANLWGQVEKFVGQNANDFFGISVAIDGDYALVGAAYEDGVGEDSGVVYVYELDSGVWAEVATLTPDEAAEFDRFGIAVAISGDTAIIGADGSANPDPSNGGAYIFQHTGGGTWEQIARLTANDSVAHDQFGLSVTIDGDLAAVGCPFDDDGAANAGSAYVFERNQGGDDEWGVVAKVLGDNPTAESRFGIGVSLDGELLLVGSDQDDTSLADAGAVYVFSQNFDSPDAWGQIAQVTSADPAVDVRFGNAVAISGDRAVVGSELDDQAGPDAGAMHILSLDGADCNTNGICDEIEILNGSTADQNENGIPDECECLADITGDSFVDWFDLMYMYTEWGPCTGCVSDLNFDDVVDMADLLIWLASRGPCP